MKTQQHLQNKNIIRIALVTVFILLIPLIAMQFTDEVVWSLADFVVMGALLFSTGLAYEFLVRKTRNTTYRVAVGVAVVVVFLLVWAELAVGIFGTPFAGS